MIAEGLQEKAQVPSEATNPKANKPKRKRKVAFSKEKSSLFARANAKARLRKGTSQSKKSKMSHFFDTFKLGAEVSCRAMCLVFIQP